MLTFGLYAVVAVLAAVGVGRLERFEMRRWSRFQVRELRGRHGALIAIGGTAAWVGACLILGWTLVRFAPSREIRDLSNQPAPSWLWQIGAPLAVLGVVIAVVSVLAAPVASADVPSALSKRGQWVLLSALLLATDLPLVLCAIAAKDSALRGMPILVAAVVSIYVVVVLPKQHPL